MGATCQDCQLQVGVQGTWATMGRSVRKNGKNRDSPGCDTAGAAALDATPTAAPATAPPVGSDKDKQWDRRVKIASCVSFFMGCVWILLFPLVTVTTGETKPRGAFFDENALLVHHTSTKLTAADVDWAKPSRLSKAYPQQVKQFAMMCTARRSTTYVGIYFCLGTAEVPRLSRHPVLSDMSTCTFEQDGVVGSEWVCTVLRGMDLPCYAHTFYEGPKARSGLRKRYATLPWTAEVKMAAKSLKG